ncbi:hypothetical protein DXG01_007331 [Tephrocybe rancida]|nr:hypothetical protein DXG01_007331 [Tephrocybe rancida]
MLSGTDFWAATLSQVDPAWNTHNNPLASRDQLQIQRLISDAKRVLVLLDTGIDVGPPQSKVNDALNTPNALRTTQDMREHVLKCLDSLRKAIAPHRQLPDEILILIFTLCIPNSISVPLRPPNANQTNWNWPLPQPSAWQTTEPWNLLAVSVRWRRLTLETPTLWSNLTFRLKKMDHYTHRVALFNLLLGYSGAGTPLELHVIVDDCNSPVTQEDECVLKELVGPHARRLRGLFLSLPAPVLDQFFTSSSSPACFDLLEVVQIDYPGRSTMSNDISRRVFRDAPQLYRFTMTAKLPLSSLELPWGHLRHLHLCDTIGNAKDCYHALQRCPSLVSCTIGLNSHPSQDTTGHGSVLGIPIILSNLTSFTLESGSLSLLVCLDLPALECLTLRCDLDQTSCEATLLPFLRRSPQITTLVLCWWVPSITIKTILHAVPLLTHLQFVPGRTAEVFKLLWAIDLLPNLESLVFLCYPVIWEEVVEIIGLRGMVGRLRNVDIKTFFRKEVDGWERDPRLQTLKEIGVTMRLTHIIQGQYS